MEREARFVNNTKMGGGGEREKRKAERKANRGHETALQERTIAVNSLLHSFLVPGYIEYAAICVRNVTVWPGRFTWQF